MLLDPQWASGRTDKHIIFVSEPILPILNILVYVGVEQGNLLLCNWLVLNKAIIEDKAGTGCGKSVN